MEKLQRTRGNLPLSSVERCPDLSTSKALGSTWIDFEDFFWGIGLNHEPTKCSSKQDILYGSKILKMNKYIERTNHSSVYLFFLNRVYGFMDQLSEMIYHPKLEVFLLHMSGYYRPYLMPKDTYLTGSFQNISNTSAQCNLKLSFQSVILYPMTDPWCWYKNANIDWGYIDGIHGTPYIAAPWILYTNGDVWGHGNRGQLLQVAGCRIYPLVMMVLIWFNMV